MRILITNDDGVFAEGIRLLAEWAKKLGEVTVVAPKREQSGKSHAINFTEPMEIKRVDLMDGVEAYSCDSTPADCVRYGIAGLNRTYDLVLSGINRGVNLGVDMIYSGTVAAIFEAAYWNHNALAFSTYPDAAGDAAHTGDDQAAADAGFALAIGAAAGDGTGCAAEALGIHGCGKMPGAGDAVLQRGDDLIHTGNDQHTSKDNIFDKSTHKFPIKADFCYFCSPKTPIYKDNN